MAGSNARRVEHIVSWGTCIVVAYDEIVRIDVSVPSHEAECARLNPPRSLHPGVPAYTLRSDTENGGAMRAILIVAVSVLALTGCSNSVAIREAVGQGTRQFVGADLVLREPLPIAAGKARVFLQDGIVSAGDGGLFSRSYDQYRPLRIPRSGR